jgi:hypothetical protein
VNSRVLSTVTQIYPTIFKLLVMKNNKTVFGSFSVSICVCKCRTKWSCSSFSGCCFCIWVLRFQHSARALLGNLSPHCSTAPTTRLTSLSPASSRRARARCLAPSPPAATACFSETRTTPSPLHGGADPAASSTPLAFSGLDLVAKAVNELEVGSSRYRREAELHSRG